MSKLWLHAYIWQKGEKLSIHKKHNFYDALHWSYLTSSHVSKCFLSFLCTPCIPTSVSFQLSLHSTHLRAKKARTKCQSRQVVKTSDRA